MNTVVGVSAAAVFAAVCGLLLKKTNKEVALLFSVGVSCVLFLYLIPQMEPLTAWVEIISGSGEFTQVIAVVFKALGITLTAHAAVHICKEAGENALAAGVEFAAKLAVLLLLLPILEQLLEVIREILLL